MKTPDPERAAAVVVASHMQRLLATQEWDIFAAQVAGLERQWLTRLRKAPRDEIEDLQGRLQGLMDVMSLPQTLIAHARRP